MHYVIALVVGLLVVALLLYVLDKVSTAFEQKMITDRLAARERMDAKIEAARRADLLVRAARPSKASGASDPLVTAATTSAPEAVSSSTVTGPQSGASTSDGISEGKPSTSYITVDESNAMLAAALEAKDDSGESA